MRRVRVVTIMAIASLVLPAVAGCAEKKEPPSPTAQAAERLHAAAGLLDQAGSVTVLFTVTASGGVWSATERGTAWMSLGAAGAASRATGDLKIDAAGNEQSVELKFRDPGTGTTYLHAPSTGTKTRPWRAFTGFAEGPGRGVVVPLGHLLSAAVLDPREYLRPATTGTGEFLYSETAEPGHADTTRFDGTCQLKPSCAPGERFGAWLAANSMATEWFNTTVRLGADGTLDSYEVTFDFGPDRRNVVTIKIKAVVSKTGEPVTVTAPPAAQTIPAA